MKQLRSILVVTVQSQQRSQRNQTPRNGQVQTATFVNPAGLLSIGGNLMQETNASGPAVIGTPGENGFGHPGGL